MAAVAAVLLAGACTGASTGPEVRPAVRTTPTGSPSAADQTPISPSKPRRVTVVMSGDVLLHTGVWQSAQVAARAAGRPGMDFRPMFASMRPVYRRADLAICHLETPLARPGGPFLNYPVFSVPPQVLPGLTWAGIDACTTASNHSLDQGLVGLERTLAMLDSHDIAHAGTAESRHDARTPLLMDVGGVTVALLSYAYGTNGFPIPPQAPWSIPLINVHHVLRDARRARADGASIVLVALHAGTEYTTAPNAQQLRVVKALTRSPDIDLVYGHHAHVVQPFDVVHGTWVAYGLGNFVAQQPPSIPDTYRGVTARFTFVEQRDGSFAVKRARFIPTMITPYAPGGPPMRVLDAPAALRDPDTDPALRPALREAVQQVRADVFSLGARRHGLRMAS